MRVAAAAAAAAVAMELLSSAPLRHGVQQEMLVNGTLLQEPLKICDASAPHL